MKIITFFTLLLIIANFTIAQENNRLSGAEFCSNKKSHNPQSAELINSQNTPRHSFDVLNYKLNMDIYNCFKSPNPKNFTASNLITFRVDSVLSSIQLNAIYTSLVIDSIRLQNGPLLTFNHSSSTNLITINLDRTFNPNEVVNLTIYYRHNNVSDNAFYVNTSGFVYTDCEPEGARKWFPCWDRPYDKATVDITTKVPSNVKLGSNGRLADSTATSDTIWYHWVSRDPVSTYLVVLTGRVNYNCDIVWWHKLSNPNDSIPIRLYYSTGETITPTKNAMVDMTNYYSQMFGEHPFEKNGFASVSGYGGGMENQTLTTIYPTGWSSVMALISHEYGHQWFGDMITCGTWADIWLNEGFATYLEALYYEHVSGYSAYKSSINGDASSYISGNPGWPIYNPQWAIITPPNSQLFNGPITYYKGACVLHMLRYTIGDSLFFAAFHAYATDTVNFKLKNAVTDDFAAKVSSVAGQNLTWFFDEWVKQPNHPAYQNSYGISNLGGGNWKVNFLANQTQTNTVFHKMPIVIKVSFTTGSDSSIRVMNDTNNQLFQFTFNRQPTVVAFDPNNDIVLKTATLSVGVVYITEPTPTNYALYQNEPNPFNPETRISFDIPKKSLVKLSVFDLLGREIINLVNGSLEAGRHSVKFNGAELSSGIYFYKIEAGNYIETKKMILIK